MTEEKEVAVWTKTADEGGTRGGIKGLALVAHEDFAVVANADTSLLTPDVGPPGAGEGGTDDGAFFSEGLLVGGVGCLAEFAVDFMLIGVWDELVEQLVGPDQFGDAVGGQEGDESFLPIVVAAFDFAFGLVCGLHPRRTNQNGFSPARIPFTLGVAGASS